MKQQKTSLIEDNYGKILHLTLKKEWFNMILSGEKTEEYRDIKQFWESRFIDQKLQTRYDVEGSESAWKDYDVIKFRNGYQKDAPEIYINFLGYNIDYGNSDWGAERGKQYFILNLGEILLTNNIKES